MRTFEAARKIGAFCILDAPSIEHKAASNLLQLQPTPHELEINRRKDREVALADLILTCSKLAAQTYLDAGVASDKVRSVLLGATAPQSLAGRFTGNQTTRFVFAGRFTYRKSADLLLSVFRRLNQEGEDATLEILGNAGDEGYLGEIANSRNIKYHGHVNQEFLFSAIAAADCLLLPSRFDAFGMVVAEALTVGTPVIISDATGACEILQNHPNCGWITEASEESLYECIRARLKNRAELARAREHAKVAGLSLDWSVYRSRIAKIMRDVDLAKSGR
jgi:glycosyltransferase involved in cell wall biosynthesis